MQANKSNKNLKYIFQFRVTFKLILVCFLFFVLVKRPAFVKLDGTEIEAAPAPAASKGRVK